MFGDIRTGILLLITHILACITVGILFRFWKSNISNSSEISTQVHKYHFSSSSKTNVNFSNLGEILSSAVMNSIHSILLIGGFVVLFSVIISMLDQSKILYMLSQVLHPVLHLLGLNPKFGISILTGIIELTSGINSASLVHLKAISQNIIIASFLLGFGGICVLLQVSSIISKVHLSIKPYVIGKVLHGIFAALYTYLFLNISLFFNLNIG